MKGIGVYTIYNPNSLSLSLQPTWWAHFSPEALTKTMKDEEKEQKEGGKQPVPQTHFHFPPWMEQVFSLAQALLFVRADTACYLLYCLQCVLCGAQSMFI